MNISIGDISSIESPNRDSPGPHRPTLFNNMRHTRLPGSRWEVSPGYHLWGERKSGEQNALPLLVTGDRQARKPANDGIPHTAVEVLTELANDLVSGAGCTHRFTDAASMRRHWKSTEGNTMTDAAATQTKCTYCGKPAEKVVRRNIHDRTRDPYTNRQVLRTRELSFCNAEHASNYQMGCEG